MPREEVCFYHLMGGCKYGVHCYRQHITEDQLSNSQAKAFARFRDYAPPSSSQEEQGWIEEESATEEEEEFEQEAVSEDDVDVESCLLSPLRLCPWGVECKYKHRSLALFDDGELEKLQQLLHRATITLSN